MSPPNDWNSPGGGEAGVQRRGESGGGRVSRTGGRGGSQVGQEGSGKGGGGGIEEGAERERRPKRAGLGGGGGKYEGKWGRSGGIRAQFFSAVREV